MELSLRIIHVLPFLLEGYMKQLLQAKGTDNNVKYPKRLGRFFANDSNGSYYLNQWVKDDISCNETCCALEGSYNLYYSKRHPYFHVNDQINTTPIIWKKNDAESLIFDVFSTIENTYTRIT